QDGLKQTPLHAFHQQQGGRMVNFAGWSMPLQYGPGHLESHLHTRRHCSLFDVSHMLQTKVFGRDRVKFMESLVVGDIAELKPDQGTLSLFTSEEGGILDDLIVTSTSEQHLYVVSNAGCRAKDWALMRGRAQELQAAGADVHLEISENALLAVQSKRTSLPRCPPPRAAALPWPRLGPTLHGACGHLPSSAPPNWPFYLLCQKNVAMGYVAGEHSRVGTARAAALPWPRLGPTLHGACGHLPSSAPPNSVPGEVTSGCPSPCLKKNVAMGYVAGEHSRVGTALMVEVRKKSCPALVTKMPFVPTRYHTLK
uniref:Aminomethyltransferase, mitochondrial n=1 Tax=Pelodiscus sinensis TaxID=13735 RepID=K7GF70_PELSI